MRVLYDFQIFSAQKYGGISRYFYELSKAPEALYSAKIAARYHKNHYLQDIVVSSAYPINCYNWFGGNSYPGKSILCKCWDTLFPCLDPDNENKEYIKDCLTGKKIDLFHPTYYDDYFLKFIGEKPFVLTVYDMIHELFPEFFLNDKKTNLLKRKLILAANHIIAISEQTKKDIVEFYGVELSKITVVPLANSLPEQCVDNIFTDFKLKFILYVGERGLYKNFYFLLRAITDFLRNDKSLNVVCTGKPFSTVELAFFDSLGIASKQMHSYSVNDNELSSLYRNAQMFVFPSLYEGFGIPVLEAFSCGCPVILSNTGSLPEVGGEAAIYINPKSVHEVRVAVKKVLDCSSNARKELVKNGYERLKNFSWQKTMEQTYSVYCNVLTDHPAKIK